MIYIILFILSFTLTYLIKNYAIKKSFVAEINERSSHSVVTPHGGGVAVAVTWFVGLIYLYFTSQIEPELFYALSLGAIISIVGFVDDIVELKPKTRMIVFVSVGLLGLYALGGLSSITFGLFSVENPFVTTVFALLLILWYINLYNFLDGINGYAGSEAIFLAMAGFVLFSGSHFLVLAVAVLGFLYWNYNKAKIFMGDVGSTLLGYNVAIFTLYYANEQASNLWVWVVLFGVFWFDATYTLLRRKLNAEKLSQAHKKHAYQRLNQSGWSHFKVTNYSILLNVLLFCIVYFISNVFIAFSIAIVLLYSSMKFVDSRKAF